MCTNFSKTIGFCLLVSLIFGAQSASARAAQGAVSCNLGDAAVALVSWSPDTGAFTNFLLTTVPTAQQQLIPFKISNAIGGSAVDSITFPKDYTQAGEDLTITMNFFWTKCRITKSNAN